ncbi:MAG: hypothetical protein ACLGIC_00250 [Acidimicrobiia bacterium]
MSTTYELNDDAMEQAKALIDDGRYDWDTSWSDAAPSTDDGNDVIDAEGYDGYGRWHLGIDVDASEETKGRFAFPYGDFDKVVRSAVIHGKQRASQNDHDELVDAFDELLQRLDEAEGETD